MPDKEKIFDNVTEYSSEELAQYIMDGLFSMMSCAIITTPEGWLRRKRGKK